MMKEIMYTHQEAQGTPKNAGKQSNPGKERVNKIRLKNDYLLLLLSVFGFPGSWLTPMGFL